MAWPSNLRQVQCIGFSRKLLPILMEAIENEHVEWRETGGYAELTTAEFDYLGYRYRMSEYAEVVHSIEKIARLDPVEVVIDGALEEVNAATPIVNSRKVKPPQKPKDYATW